MDLIIDIPTPEQRRACWKAYHKALDAGELIRATFCAWCGSEEGTTQGHHPDYARPLMVVWLCKGCHGKHHVKYADERRVFNGLR